MKRRAMVILGVAAMLLSACGDGEQQVEPSQVRSGEGWAALYLDGWSARSMRVEDLRFGALDDTDPGRVALRDIEAGDVAQLLAQRPEILEQLLGRMVTADPTLRCDTKGCGTEGGPVDPYLLLDPGKIPGLGEMYRAFGVSTGAKIAELRVGESGTGRLRYGTAGLVLDDASVRRDPRGAEYRSGEEPVPAPENGFVSGMWVAGYGLGELFVLDAGWLQEPGSVYRVTEPQPAGPQNEETVGPLTQLALSEPLFMSGLGDLGPGAEGLNEEQLSFMTAPSTGCGGVALCIPGVVESKHTVVQAERLDVCAQTKWRAGLVLNTSEVSVGLPGPIHQAGAWGGKTMDQFPGARKVPVLFTGVPPLVEGRMRLRLQSAYLIDEDRLVSAEVRVGELGVDEGDAVRGVLGGADLPRLFNGILRMCPAGVPVPATTGELPGAETAGVDTAAGSGSETTTTTADSVPSSSVPANP